MTFFRIPSIAVLSVAFVALSLPLAAQSVEPRSAQSAPAMNAAAASPPPSGILRPALGILRQALQVLRTEKWKAPREVTGEASSDIGSIERDLDATLPPLLAAADAAPASMPQLLPAYRNVEALYDVLVRVTQTAVLAAPAQQSVALQQATQILQQSRREFGDLLDAAAQSQDRQLHEVQARLRTIQAAPPPPAPVCPPPPPPVRKPRPRSRPRRKVAKPSTTAPQNAAPASH